MSELVVAGFPSETQASDTWDALRKRPEMHADLEDGGIVVHRHDGSYEVRAGHRSASDVLTWSNFWGFLAHLVLMVPIIGFQTTALYDSLAQALDESQINREFRDQIRGLLPPGASAMLAVVRSAAPEDLAKELEARGARVLRTPLKPGDEERILESIHGGRVIE